MCDPDAALEDLTAVHEDVRQFADGQLSKEADEWAVALKSIIERFECARAGAGPKVEVVTGSPDEVLAKFLNMGKKAEPPKVPTMDDIQSANLMMQENMRPMLGTAAFIRKQLIDQGFSEMAAEQTASNFFLGSMLAGRG